MDVLRLAGTVGIAAALSLGGCARGAPKKEDPRIAAALSAHPVDPSVQADWVQMNVVAALAFKDALPPKGDAEAFVASLRSEVPVTWTDLGFGLRAATAVRIGGTMRCVAQVLAFEGALVEVEAWCGSEITYLTNPKTDSWPKVKALVVGTMGPGFEVRERHVGNRYDFAGARARAEAARAAELGPQSKASPPPELAEAYAALVSPHAQLRFGTACGAGGGAPPGRKEMAALVQAGRFDLIHDVLRGPSPVGRVYAAEALLAHRPLTLEDAAVIHTVRALPIGVPSCSGCTHDQPDAASLLLPE